MDVMQSLDLPDADMKKICYQNAETLFGLIPPQSAH
jgi:predicted TIM-barrel fold metal-dependent hydrolase